jgi:hypothetical protein
VVATASPRRENLRMKDLLFVLVVVAFFALMTLYVLGCDRIIGTDDDVEAIDADAPQPFDREAA